MKSSSASVSATAMRQALRAAVVSFDVLPFVTCLRPSSEFTLTETQAGSQCEGACSPQESPSPSCPSFPLLRARASAGPFFVHRSPSGAHEVDPAKWRTIEGKQIFVDMTRKPWLPDDYGQGVKMTNPISRSKPGSGGTYTVFISPEGRVFYHRTFGRGGDGLGIAGGRRVRAFASLAAAPQGPCGGFGRVRGVAGLLSLPFHAVQRRAHARFTHRRR